MLGRIIRDPEQVEAAGRTELAGMGLLETETTFAPQKVQTQVKGRFAGLEGLLSCLNGLDYTGYEIHMGRSDTAQPPIQGRGNVYGTYLHGLFDAPDVAEALLTALCRRKGLDPSVLTALPAEAYRQAQYDKLADALRRSLDVEYLYRVLRREV